MSAPDSFDFMPDPGFGQEFDGSFDLEPDSTPDWVAVAEAAENIRVRQSQYEVLGILGRLPIEEDAQRGVRFMSDYLDHRPDADLGEAAIELRERMHRLSIELKLAEALAGRCSDEKREEYKALTLLEERVSFVSLWAGTHQYGDPDKAELQTQILASTVLPEQEKMLWVDTIGQHVEGEGIDLSDLSASLDAVSLYEVGEQVGLERDDARKEARATMDTALAHLLKEHGVAEHDDLADVVASITHMLALEVGVTPGTERAVGITVRHQLKRLEARVAIMGWPEERLASFVAELRAIRDGMSS